MVEDAIAAAFRGVWTNQHMELKGPLPNDLHERVRFVEEPERDWQAIAQSQPSFHGTIAEVLEMHDLKNRDYGIDADPFANVRQSEQFGVPAWLGAIVRLNDKITRIKAWTRNKSLANESLRDSLIDIVVYGAIAVTLFDQEQADV